MNIDETMNEKINIDDRFIEAHKINGIDSEQREREKEEGPEGRVFVERVENCSEVIKHLLAFSRSLSRFNTNKLYCEM
jgi:hypothetical protein